MRDFLKTYIHPLLLAIHVDTVVYKIFFGLRSMRLRANNFLLYKFTKTVPVLTYHRIATANHDPHSLCVSPTTFEQHLQFLTTHYDAISLHTLQERLGKKQLVGNEAIVTFDDGYLDNLTNALPLLEKYAVPATIFVTTAHLGEQAQFPWDTEYQPHERARFLSSDQIRTLSRHPLIEIGAHTHSHPRLSTLTPAEQHVELQQCRDILEQIISYPVTQFAYPFGGIFDYTKETADIARGIGFEIICNTDERFVTASSSPLTITRFNIRNWPTAVLTSTLFNQVTNK